MLNIEDKIKFCSEGIYVYQVNKKNFEVRVPDSSGFYCKVDSAYDLECLAIARAKYLVKRAKIKETTED